MLLLHSPPRLKSFVLKAGRACFLEVESRRLVNGLQRFSNDLGRFSNDLRRSQTISDDLSRFLNGLSRSSLP